MEAPKKPRVLCVDDEPQILEGLQLHLRRHFEVTCATSGAQGLEHLGSGKFSVVLSDMRMPVMNGAAFLRAVHERAPSTVRMLLTGDTDLSNAISAVNDGQIFRFLSKPCAPAELIKAFQAAVEQHRLVTAEKVLLEETLRGSVRALTDLLSLAQPAAFGRATRANRTLMRLCSKAGIADRWELEVAAMLSQIGCVTLPDEVVQHIYEGAKLSESERELQARLPQLAEQLLGHIPRLEKVRAILLGQGTPFVRPAAAKEVPYGAHLLRLVLDLDELEAQKLSREDAVKALCGRAGLYDPALLAHLQTLAAEDTYGSVRELKLRELELGMVFAADVRTRGGVLVIARGHSVTQGLLERLRNLPLSYGIEEPIRVSGA